MEKYICIHGHFYQPPRENPWLEDVELQDSAYPYHDWNERINTECYAPNAASRVVDSEGKVVIIGNNYSSISYNFGPTLLSWMEKHAPAALSPIIEADRLSREKFSGHGSAMAQAYNHMILPLANQQDRETQIVWGIRDFQSRFGRFPEGMWLPETAVNTEVLDILAAQGIRFTVLSPHQALKARPIGKIDWFDVSGGRIDTRRPYLCTLPSGRTIGIFFYDGFIARDVAFGGLLNSGEAYAERLLNVFSENGDTAQIANVATDGETYGHHHRYGDMALCYCLNYLEGKARVTNYGEFFEKFPPSHEVMIIENSSWSCAHGVERWRNNCGCNSGMHNDWNQRWRAPLRAAFDWLRDTLAPLFETECVKYIADPWAARNDYLDVILHRSKDSLGAFFAKHAFRDLFSEEKVRVVKLFEMQRNAMLMYTSCGWYFDEVSGIETVQVLQYSCMAMQYAQEITGLSLETEYRRLLAAIPTNIPEFVNGEHIYDMFVKPVAVDFLRVGAHYAVSALFDDFPEHIGIYCYTADTDIYDKRATAKSKLFVCRAHLTSSVTQERVRISAAALHLGDNNIICGVRYFIDDASSDAMYKGITSSFKEGNILSAIKLIEKQFEPHTYSLDSLFKDEKRKLIDKIVQPLLDQVDVSLAQACDGSCAIIDYYRDSHLPVPRKLATIVSYRMNSDMEKIFELPIDIDHLRHVADEIKKWGVDLDRDKTGLMASRWINQAMERLRQDTGNTGLVREIGEVVAMLNDIAVPLNLWRSQNIYYELDRTLHDSMQVKAGDGDDHCRSWLNEFHALGDKMRVRAS